MNIIFLIISIIFLLIIIFLVFWKFWFLRDPERQIPNGEIIIAPADGKILKIIDIENIDEISIEKGLVGKIKTLCSDVGNSCYLISIYMSLMSVHIQRAAQSGKVLSVHHENGKLGVTMSFKNGLMNEKTETLIENKKIGKFKIIQIAGFVVKRIDNWLNPGDNVIKGQRMGLINFGSQVSLILPKKNVEIKVKPGQKVYAGSTIIAEIK